MKRWAVYALILSAAVQGGVVLAQEETAPQEPEVYGAAIMSPDEILLHRWYLRHLEEQFGAEQRDEFLADHRREIQARADRMGVVLTESGGVKLEEKERP